MAFKSKAQVAKFASLVKQGKMKESVFSEWLGASKSVDKLPSRASKPAKAQKVKVIK
jgi:hypothetical protein